MARVQLSMEMWLSVLWLLDDNADRAAFRVLSRSHLDAGERGRRCAEGHVRRPPGWAGRPDCLWRMMFWTPMAGRIHIGAPPRMVGQAGTVQRAIDDRFAELCEYFLANQSEVNGRLWVTFSSMVSFPHRRHCMQQHNGVWITYFEAYNIVG